MKTRAAAKTCGNAAKYLMMMARAVKDKECAQQMKNAAAALAQVRASLNRKANRKAQAHTFTVAGFAPAK